MSTLRFNVGDRVVGNGIMSNKKITGLTGTIIGEYSTFYYRVEFDKYNRTFHDCGGLCKDGYGWDVYEEYLQKHNINIDKFYRKIGV